MNKITSLLMIVCLTLCSTMFSLADGSPPDKSIVIPDGTEFSAVTTETITSKTATEGDPINLKIEEDLVINGFVVLAKGTLVKGEVTDAKGSGHFGRGGKLSVRINSTETVDHQKIKLRASKGREGGDKTGTTVALVVLFGPLGFLKKGKQAEIKEGTRVKLFTDEAITVIVSTP